MTKRIRQAAQDRAYNKTYYQKNRERILAKAKDGDNLKHQIKKFGITVEDFHELLAKQNGVCAICGRDGDGRRLSVDHSHSTNIVRGLLCLHCNSALGYVRDDIETLTKMIEYLRLYSP